MCNITQWLMAFRQTPTLRAVKNDCVGLTPKKALRTPDSQISNTSKNNLFRQFSIAVGALSVMTMLGYSSVSSAADVWYDITPPPASDVAAREAFSRDYFSTTKGALPSIVPPVAGEPYPEKNCIVPPDSLAIPAPDLMTGKRVVTINAHPDDETFDFGYTVRAALAGADLITISASGGGNGRDTRAFPIEIPGGNCEQQYYGAGPFVLPPIPNNPYGFTNTSLVLGLRGTSLDYYNCLTSVRDEEVRAAMQVIDDMHVLDDNGHFLDDQGYGTGTVSTFILGFYDGFRDSTWLRGTTDAITDVDEMIDIWGKQIVDREILLNHNLKPLGDDVVDDDPSTKYHKKAVKYIANVIKQLHPIETLLTVNPVIGESGHINHKAIGQLVYEAIESLPKNLRPKNVLYSTQANVNNSQQGFWYNVPGIHFTDPNGVIPKFNPDQRVNGSLPATFSSPINYIDYQGAWRSPYRMLQLFGFAVTDETNTKDVVICNPTDTERRIGSASFGQQVSQGNLPSNLVNNTTCVAATKTCTVRLRSASGRSSQVFLTHDQVKSDFADGTNNTIKMLLGTPNATKLIIPTCTTPFTNQNCKAP